jgi:hypothetical protein
MIEQPSRAVRSDREHRDHLSEEDDPDRPVRDRGNRAPRLVGRRLLDEDHRDDEQRSDDHRPGEEPLDALRALVHRRLFRRPIAITRPR